jgi:hypothetical protein
MGTAKVFQVSDLANNRTEFIDEARSGLARLRDKDGTSLVMLPEARLAHLQRMQDLNEIFLRLSHLVATGKPALSIELGKHAWLRVFDLDDLQEFASELEEALAAAVGDGDTVVADEVVDAWRVTARQLSDPLRRSVLLGEVTSPDLVDACRPEDDSEGDLVDE